MKEIQGKQYIAGKWISHPGTHFVSTNPYNNASLWQGPMARSQEVSSAFHAASEAFTSWSLLSVEQRAVFLLRFAKEVEQHKDAIATCISQETGKPLWEAKTEVTSATHKIPLSMEAYQERNAPKTINISPTFAHTRYKPLGVIAVLGPFNFPLHLPNGHIIPALLAGNTVLFKPSEFTPATAQWMLTCFEKAELPKGVLNCLQGDARVGEKILQTKVQGVFFTGSYRAGKNIHAHFHHKPEVLLALEMGGNNPLVIEEVADIEAAVYHTLVSSFLTSGQRCTCARRVFVKVGTQGDQLITLLLEKTQKLRRGAYTDSPEPFMGPVISHAHALAHIKAQETLITLGGKPLLTMALEAEEGALLSPGIIDMTGASSFWDEEIFAPLIQLYRYHTLEEAITKANQTAFGLCASLFSDSRADFALFYERIKAGMIHYNRPTTLAHSTLPFGGIGFSGNYRPSAYFATDYCSYAVASLENSQLTLPKEYFPGID